MNKRNFLKFGLTISTFFGICPSIALSNEVDKSIITPYKSEYFPEDGFVIEPSKTLLDKHNLHLTKYPVFISDKLTTETVRAYKTRFGGIQELTAPIPKTYCSDEYIDGILAYAKNELGAKTIHTIAVQRTICLQCCGKCEKTNQRISVFIRFSEEVPKQKYPIDKFV